MPSGGRRPGAGRKPGSPNKLPQMGSRLDRELDKYKQTVMSAVPFRGDSLELLRAVYRGDYLATHDQIYAAGQCLRFEHPPAVILEGRPVEEIREEIRKELTGDPEENRREMHAILATFARAAIAETVSRMNGHARGASGPPAWIGELVGEMLAEQQSTPISEITEPPSPKPRFRKRTGLEIDGEALQHGRETTNKSKSDQSPKPRRADTQSNGQTSKMAAKPDLSDGISSHDAEPEVEMMDVPTPTRSGWLIKRVPVRGSGRP